MTLLEIVSKVAKNKETDELTKTLVQGLNKNMQRFLTDYEVAHPARAQLRQLIYQKKVEVSPFYQKLLVR